MSFAHEKRAAAHLLTAIEDGSHSTANMRPLYEEADPALVYLIFAWLRARYRPGHSAAEGVLGRIVALCKDSSIVAGNVRKGERDSIVVWFEETYDYGDMDRDEFISLVIEKLEG